MVASTVLRCDDSIKYHPGNNEPGISTGERTRFFSAANIAGGSIISRCSTCSGIREKYKWNVKILLHF